MLERVPPHDLDAEQAVLASIICDTQALTAAVDIGLKPGDFYRAAHAAIFAAALELAARREPVDLITMRAEMTKRDQLADVGGYGYLVDLASSVPTTAHTEFYAKRLAALAKRRELIALCSDAIGAAFDPEVADPIGGAQRALLALDLGRGGSGEWKSLGDLYRENWNRMEEAQAARAKGEPSHVVSTGFHDLDQMLAIAAGDMVVLAARTGYGKTSMAANIAIHVARSKPVAMFTLEMSGLAMARRFLATHTGLSVHRQSRGDLLENEWKEVAAMLKRHAELPLFIRDKAHVTPSEMLAACRRLEAQRREKLGLVVVDYLTLADADGKTENETTRAAKVSRGLKLMAGELGCPVLALAQLNRGVDGREGKRPELRDLKQSGSIEQDASVVLMIHREGHKDGAKLESGLVEVIVAKNRNGPTGSVVLHFDAGRTLFTDNHGSPAEWRVDYADR